MRRIPLLVLLLLSVFARAHAGPKVPLLTAVTQQQMPGSRVLLQRVLKAHKNLGPSFIESTTRSETATGVNSGTTRIWMRRNDSRHYVMSWEIEPGFSIVTHVSDPKKVSYTPSDNTYVRERLGSDNGDAALFGMLDYIEMSFSDPDAHAQFSRTKVLPIIYQGIPCYKVVWDPRSPTETTVPPPPKDMGLGGPPLPGAYIAPFRILIVGRKDGLVRKLTHDSGTGETITQVITYQFKSRPYPPSTFDFKPPRGAKEEVYRVVD